MMEFPISHRASKNGAVCKSLIRHSSYWRYVAAAQKMFPLPAKGSTYRRPKGGMNLVIGFANPLFPPGYPMRGSRPVKGLRIRIVGSATGCCELGKHPSLLRSLDQLGERVAFGGRAIRTLRFWPQPYGARPNPKGLQQ